MTRVLIDKAERHPDLDREWQPCADGDRGWSLEATAHEIPRSTKDHQGKRQGRTLGECSQNAARVQLDFRLQNPELWQNTFLFLSRPVQSTLSHSYSKLSYCQSYTFHPWVLPPAVTWAGEMVWDKGDLHQAWWRELDSWNPQGDKRKLISKSGHPTSKWVLWHMHTCTHTSAHS